MQDARSECRFANASAAAIGLRSRGSYVLSVLCKAHGYSIAPRDYRVEALIYVRHNVSNG